MTEQKYIPDRTLKNAWTMVSARRSSTVVLSCKQCPGGVSPKGYQSRLVILIVMFFMVAILFPLFQSLVGKLAPQDWSVRVKRLITALLTFGFGLPVFTVCILPTFRFMKWIPAASPDKEDAPR